MTIDAGSASTSSEVEGTVARSGWLSIAFVVLSNHLHLLVRTPRPNLGRGMQFFLSGFAQWVGKRRRRGGHLFQGRYRAELIEDESYYWTVSRYIHLNPVRARLVERPEQWELSFTSIVPIIILAQAIPGV